MSGVKELFSPCVLAANASPVYDKSNRKYQHYKGIHQSRIEPDLQGLCGILQDSERSKLLFRIECCKDSEGSEIGS